MFIHRHYHKDFELLYLYEGRANIEINEKNLFVKAGDVILLNPYDSHYGEILSDSFGYACLNFDVSITGVQEGQEILDGKLAFPSYLPSPNPFLSCVESACREYEEGLPGWKMRVSAALMTIFSYLTDALLPAGGGRSNQFFRNLIEYVANHYTLSISSRDAAEFFGYTHSYFCRLMKRCFRSSFSEYLRIYRLSVAKTLLRDHSVTETAVMVGYSDISRFSNDFRKSIGVSPSRFKKIK